MIRGNIVKKPPTREAHFNTSIHNRFDIEVVDAVSGKIKKKAVAYNIICNKLWTTLASGSTYFSYIQYGRGSGTPTASDTSLFSRIADASASNATYSLDYETGVYSLRKSIQLTASTAVGETITEVGIASASGNGNLCTHAMLQDMNGNQISIQKTDLDVVNIYATVFVHFNQFGYDNGSIRFIHADGYPNRGLLGYFAEGGSWAFVGSMHVSSSFGNSKGGLSTGFYPVNLGSESGYTSVTKTWDANNKTLTLTANRLEAASFNVGGIRRLCLSYCGTNYYRDVYPQLLMRTGGSWFPYSEIVAEAVGTGDGATKDFALDFPFAHNLKAYIDGVETTEFTLDYAPSEYGTDTNKLGYAVNMEYIDLNSTPDNHIPYIGNTTGNSGQFKGTRIFYNPCYELGIEKIYVGYDVTCYVSNDLQDWVELTKESLNYNVPAEYQHYKYWKGVNTSTSERLFAYQMSPPSTYVGKALHFDNPPPKGAVITVDYQSDCIAKDSNHVFDVSVVIHFGEYTETE